MGKEFNRFSDLGVQGSRVYGYKVGFRVLGVKPYALNPRLGCRLLGF